MHYLGSESLLSVYVEAFCLMTSFDVKGHCCGCFFVWRALVTEILATFKMQRCENYEVKIPGEQ